MWPKVLVLLFFISMEHGFVCGLFYFLFLQESFGVIADEATTMRDPFFFRWHAWIDDVFQRHKESSYVRAYTRSEVGNYTTCLIKAWRPATEHEVKFNFQVGLSLIRLLFSDTITG